MTIPLDPHYIPAFSIEDVLLDKDTGAPLSGGLVYFEQDNQRGTLKPVYQITGTSPNYTFIQLPNPITLSSIGTFEDSLSNPVIPYFYPYDADGNVELYYVRVTNSDDVPQFDREAQPYISGSGSSTAASAFVNELSNPQFAEVLFDVTANPYIYNFTAATLEVVEIAPGWEIEVSCAGAGTVSVSQITPIGSLNRITNPGTILNINSSGLSRLRLRQRFYGSPNLWGQEWLAGSFVAKTYSGTDVTLRLLYSQSNGAVVDEEIVSATLSSDGLYAAYPGSVLIPESTSTQDFPDAYVDIEFDIPLSIEIDITSVMVAATGGNSIDDINYDQTTLDRQIDQLFHYYQPIINYKPISSMLVGWDFPVNPTQFGSSGNLSTSAAYIWDQTIGVRRGATNIAYARETVTNGLQFTTAGAVPDAFLIIQYLSGTDAKKILGTPLSVNMNAWRGSAGSTVTYHIYLFRGAAAAVIPTLPNIIGTVAANGVFTKNNTAGQGLNWTEIARSNLGAATGNLSTVATSDDINNGENDYGFSGWEITDTAQILDTDKFCIIVTFSYAAASTVITIDSISMVPGLIPTRPAPKTLNQTIFECEYYYQKSFITGLTPAQAVGLGNGEQNSVQGTPAPSIGIIGPIVRFPTGMRTSPNIILYNPTAADAQIRNVAGTSWSNSTITNTNANGFVTIGDPPALSAARDLTSVNWTADARLGIL